MKRLLSALLLLLVLGTGLIVVQATPARLAPPPPPPPPAGGKQIVASDIVRLGSFKVPSNIHAGGQANAGFEYGGTAMGFNPARSSLLLVGHDWDQFLGEISIPALDETAAILTNLTDASEGKSVGSDTTKVGGVLPYNGQLYFTEYIYYDGSGKQTQSHFSRPLDLSVQGQVQGPFRVGPLGAGFYSGYLGLIPSEWQAAFGGPVLTGNCCLSIVSRTSFGPAAFVIDPATIATSQKAIPLVYYPEQHQTLGKYGAGGSHPVFNGSTQVTAVVFPPGSSSVLFIGSTGLGNACYGTGSECGDPTADSKGEHAYPYRGYVWAYNASDLVAVKSRQKAAWDVKPYATWELPIENVQHKGIGGAAYDPATSRLYVSALYGDSPRPLIHAFSVNSQ